MFFDVWPKMVDPAKPLCGANTFFWNPVNYPCGYCEDGSVMSAGNCLKVCGANQFA
jgi:aerobic-type carbon monoxide dehydrogenase small subunit (CoxS/CutS family)